MVRLPPAQAKSPYISNSVALLVALIAIVFAVLSLHIPYFAITPGPTQNVVKLISIDGSPTSPVSGQLLLTTVSLTSQEVRVFDGMLSWFDSSIELLPREQIVPVGETEDDVERRTTDQMEESQVVASAAALKYLGYDVKTTSAGVRVEEIFIDVPAAKSLRRGDVIVGVDGTPITQGDQLRSLVGAHKVEDEITLTVKRGIQTVTVKTKLVPNPQEPNRPLIGIRRTFDVPNVELPLAIDIESLGIGGPSAGLTFALGIVDLLDKTDIVAKRIIAGTGAITIDGVVEPVGGVRQKVEGARDAGATVFLVPSVELELACAVAGDLKIVSVETLKEAVDLLRAKQIPTNKTCS